MTPRYYLNPSACSARTQSGLTMVELLVAVTLSTFIALAAIAALTVARTGFTAVDSSSQLRDNARFASDLIQRLAMQAGFQDVVHATATKVSEVAVKDNIDNPPLPYVIGLNNALLDAALLNASAASSSPRDPFSSGKPRTAANGGCQSAADTACINGSDVLIIRYQNSAINQNSTTPDSIMINCLGNAEQLAPVNRADVMTSVFHVARDSNGEPALMCSTRNNFTGTWDGPRPIIQGVESFQVLYGVSGAKNATAGQPLPALPASNAASSSAANNATFSANSIPDRYFRADELTVAGNDAATADNFRRVRSLRIGLLMRAGPGSSQEPGAQTFYPLGELRNRNLETRPGENGHSFLFTERGSAASPTTFSFPQDGRARQTVTFTVYLRNVQVQ